MTDEPKKTWEPHWIWYSVPLIAILLWANHSREIRKIRQHELDKICNADCRAAKRSRELDAEMRRNLSAAEYQAIKADERRFDRGQKEEEERRSHLTDEERDLLEQAESQRNDEQDQIEQTDSRY